MQLTPGEAARIAETPTANSEAHDLFLRARYLLSDTRKGREVFDQIISLLNRAIELDPDYAEAYAGLGMAHNLDFHNHLTGATDALEVAARFAALGVEKGPTVPFVHFAASLIAVWQRDLDRAKKEAEIALSLSPNDALAVGALGVVETYLGNSLAAIQFGEQAIRLDPTFAQQYMHFVGTAYLVAGKYETAAATFRERIRLAPETDLSRALLASALGHLDEADEARRVWSDLKKIHPRYSFEEHLARLPFRNKADADRIAEGLAKAGLPD